MKSFSYLKHPQIQLNLTNIGDNHYRSGSSYTANAHPQVTSTGAIAAGSAPVYYVGGVFAAMVSVSSGF
ncbi:hypothetical protein AD954_14445 [Acetobacter cerevisiae]|nr:hypothetical protein AD954_14445 [Acetobacter cerevisiae]